MTDDARQIRELVDSWIAASKARDLPALMDMMTDDVIFMTPGPAAVREGGVRSRQRTHEGRRDRRPRRGAGDRGFRPHGLTSATIFRPS